MPQNTLLTAFSWGESVFCLSTYKTMEQAQTTLEESQRMTAIRKTYQRAIVMPTHHVEQLWRDYENFENSVSRALVEPCFLFLCN